MLELKKFQINLKFKNKYPFNEAVLIDLLQEKGFEKKPIDRNIISVDRSGAPVESEILEDDKLIISSQVKRGVLAVDSTNAQDGIDGINMLIEIFKNNETLGIDLKNDIFHCETILGSLWFSNYSWYPIFKKYGTDKYDLFTEFFNEKVQSYALRISSEIPEEYINESILEYPNYHEIVMTPFNDNPKRVVVNMVYRKTEVDKALDFLQDIETKLSQLIMEMEGDQNG